MSRPEERDAVAILNSRSVFRGRVVNLSVDTVRLPNGRQTDLEMIRHPGAAVALPIETGADGAVRALLVRQYRYAADGWLLEVPGGTLDGDESPEACIRRELEEEVGYRAATLEPMGWIWTTPGFTDERIWLYLARDLEQLVAGPNLGDHEVLELERIPLSEAVSRAVDGDITDSKTVAVLLRAAFELGIGPA